MGRMQAALAVLLCASAAWAATLIGWDQKGRTVVPFAFLIVVMGLGMRYGRAVGILGSVIGALVFAHSLYRPLDSFHV